MKCEICHKNEAETAIHRHESGRDRELYVCRECAQKDRSRRHDNPRPRKGRGVSVTVVGNGPQPPPAMIDALISATADLMNEMASDRPARPRKCPTCGTSWRDVEESGRLGCPDCWRTFARELAPRLKHSHPRVEHVGLAPADAGRKALERRLQDAIRAQDYKEAGRLSKELNRLDERHEEGPAK